MLSKSVKGKQSMMRGFVVHDAVTEWAETDEWRNEWMDECMDEWMARV